MMNLVIALRWVARLDGLVALILGILLWTGTGGLLKLHILTGFVMTVTLLLVGMMGFFSRVKPVLPVVAILWAILLPYIGFAQLKWAGASLTAIQIVHLLLGVFGIGIVEALGAKITRQGRI